MKNSIYFEIRIEGYLPDSYSGWFEGLEVRYNAESNSTSIGRIADQAALIGVLNKIQSLNLIVISMKRSDPGCCVLD